MKVSVHQPEHLPWPGLIDKISQSDIYIILDHVQFRKNYFQNRNKLIGPSGPFWITIPIRKHDICTPINKIQIAYQDKLYIKWISTIKRNYSTFPFFCELYPALKAIHETDHQSLSVFNTRLIRFMLQYLGIDVKVVFSSALPGGYRDKTDMHIKLVEAVGGSTYISGPSGHEYLDIDRFLKSGLKLEFHSYSPVEYRHLYDNSSIGVSSLDLMMMHGLDSSGYIYAGRNTKLLA